MITKGYGLLAGILEGTLVGITYNQYQLGVSYRKLRAYLSLIHSHSHLGENVSVKKIQKIATLSLIQAHLKSLVLRVLVNVITLKTDVDTLNGSLNVSTFIFECILHSNKIEYLLSIWNFVCDLW